MIHRTNALKACLLFIFCIASPQRLIYASEQAWGNEINISRIEQQQSDRAKAHENCHRRATNYAHASTPDSSFSGYGATKTAETGSKVAGKAIAKARQHEVRQALYRLEYHKCMRRYND